MWKLIAMFVKWLMQIADNLYHNANKKESNKIVIIQFNGDSFLKDEQNKQLKLLIDEFAEENQ